MNTENHRTPARPRRRKKKKHRGLRTLRLLLLAGFLLIGYARCIAPYHLAVTEEAYQEPLLSIEQTQAEGLKIAVFSDTHFSDYYTPRHFENVIRRINDASPDLVFFLGDLVDDLSTYTGELSDIQESLSRIHAKAGKYAVYGNHDYGGNMEFVYPDVMKAGGFQLLVNQMETLESLNLCILGIDDVSIGYGDPEAASQLDPDRCCIVLCHEPDIVDRMLSYPIDYMYAGHTHGRQVNLKMFDPFILPAYGKKYIRGTFEMDNSRQTILYVTSGIGMTKLPLRLGSMPEISLTALKP